MANRFGEQYRPPHNGQSAFSNWLNPREDQSKSINPSQHIPIGDPYMPVWDNGDIEAGKKIYGDPVKRPFPLKNDPNADGPYRPDGGADIVRRPKPKSPKSSGGMALELPKKEKVGLW
jgi:hypothetical protein